MAYSHLTSSERYAINQLILAGATQAEISRLVFRSRSTISRELRRNIRPAEGYSFSVATALARRRRREGCSARLDDAALRETVFACLRKGWSPEQTAQRLRATARIRIGVRTIYRYIARLRQMHDPALRLLPRCPKKRRRRPLSLRRTVILVRSGIEQRPAEAADRSSVGHWEGDTLVATTGVPAIVTFVERNSRYLIARKLPSTGAVALAHQANRAFKQHGRRKRRHTITVDNGKEFAAYHEIERALNLRVYFAHPHSPWERPTVENTNGLIRHYLPKKMDLRKVSQKTLNRIVRSINDRPRKCLNWRTAAEVFRSD